MEQISFHVIVINDYNMTNTHLLENILVCDKVIVELMFLRWNYDKSM